MTSFRFFALVLRTTFSVSVTLVVIGGLWFQVTVDPIVVTWYGIEGSFVAEDYFLFALTGGAGIGIILSWRIYRASISLAKFKQTPL